MSNNSWPLSINTAPITIAMTSPATVAGASSARDSGGSLAAMSARHGDSTANAVTTAARINKQPSTI
ncbi:MAG TPA: hypothetical protein VJZ73_16040 [Methylomirabilota bacterium]|nr:hypothetical protein [Methylomirabilota bacterium]